jgi:hypothetical protein
VLTPGHFLIGCPLTSPPEPNVLDIPKNRLREFQLIQAHLQHFWKRWSSEYLPQLQRENRWISNKSENISVGDLTILKQDNIPPLQWQMVRVVKVCPGADGVVRVVTVRGTQLVQSMFDLYRSWLTYPIKMAKMQKISHQHIFINYYFILLYYLFNYVCYFFFCHCIVSQL